MSIGSFSLAYYNNTAESSFPPSVQAHKICLERISIIPFLLVVFFMIISSSLRLTKPIVSFYKTSATTRKFLTSFSLAFLASNSQILPTTIAFVPPETQTHRRHHPWIPFSFFETITTTTTTTTTTVRFLASSTTKSSSSTSKSTSSSKRKSKSKTSSDNNNKSTNTTNSMSNNDSFEYITSFNPVPDEHLPAWFLQERTRMLTNEKIMPSSNTTDKSAVVYWMQRDVRTVDNWALLLAQYVAQNSKLPLKVVYVAMPPVPKKSTSHDNNDTPPPPPLAELPWTERYGNIQLGGVQKVHEELADKNVPLYIVHPKTETGSTKNPRDHTVVIDSMMELFNKENIDIHVMICDMSPIRHLRQWNESPQLLNDSKFPIWQVDTHNVVPVWYASEKREYGARTIRPKLHKLQQDCLQASDYKKGNIPEFEGNKHLNKSDLPIVEKFDYDAHKRYMDWDESVKAVDWAKPGTKAAIEQFDHFTKNGIKNFANLRNNPNEHDVCSKLSVYFNSGQLAFATCMRQLQQHHNRDAEGKASFIEEGFIRKELSDNFCWYSPTDYDSLNTASDWAKETLDQHSTDKRKHTYTLKELEEAMTHEDLWNAAQIQLKQEGKLHGFLRMYWAKKILEWTEHPQQALDFAQYLNDHYAVDGRCPNGFVGVGWSIMGIHDQGWAEREIFGKIRYMNYNGCKRKFKVDDFVKRYPPALENAKNVTGDDNGKSGGKRKNNGKENVTTSKKTKA